MTARDVKDALRRRHPATGPNGFLGPWTCLEEWMNIDLLAVSAWASAKPYPRYARVGYEVKVSRSDYKRELARPDKRAAAVHFTHEFYFAIPDGLLKPEEIGWTPPDAFSAARAPYERERCYGLHGASCLGGRLHGFGATGTPLWRQTRFGERRAGMNYERAYSPMCPVCEGTGWIAESPAVRAHAPKLWVPADVGLLVVGERGTRIVKRAPRRTTRQGAGLAALAHASSPPFEVGMTDAQLADLIRWVSVRPDPRHAAVREPIIHTDIHEASAG